MALPKLKIPEYELVVPSTQEKIKYRPFLVKEEKVLLIAMESEEPNSVSNALSSIVTDCTFGAVDGFAAPVFDAEYIFLQVRSKSVGETATLSVICPDDGKTRVNVKINYSEVGVQMSVDHTNEIQLTDDIKMFMRYPTLNSFDSFDEKDETESTLKMMQSCVDEIHFGDDVYRRVDMSDKELSEFFDDMTTDMFSRVQEFFSTMPKLRHILDIKNPKTKKKSEYMLEGLADFFI